MILESLMLTKKASWDGDGKGYKGTIRYQNEHGAVELKLDEATSARILAVVADCIIESSRQIARDLTHEAIDSSPLLTHDESSP